VTKKKNKVSVLEKIGWTLAMPIMIPFVLHPLSQLSGTPTPGPVEYVKKIWSDEEEDELI